MNKTIFATILTTLFTTNIQADTVGLYLGGQIWQSDASGVFGEENALIDFSLQKEKQINLFVAMEHPIPFLPNARIASTTFDTSGKATLAQAFIFAEETFPTGQHVNANFNVSYIDYTLYYELVDNDVFSFDLGVTARDINGEVTVTGQAITINDATGKPITENDCLQYSQNKPCAIHTSTYIPTDTIKTSDIEPMLYVATNISLPITGLHVFAQGDFSLVGSHSLSDYQVGLSYDLIDNTMIDFNVTLGYQNIEMEFKGLNDLYTDLEFKGAFVGVIAHF